MLCVPLSFRNKAEAGAAAPSVLGTPNIQHATVAGDPRTFNYTLETSANGLIVILCKDVANAPDAVSWTATGAGAQNLTQHVADVNGAATYCEIWSLATPNVGSGGGAGVLSVGFTGSSTVSVVIYSISGWSGVAPAINSQNGANVTDPAALAIDPAPNSLIIHGVAAANDGVTITFDGAETEDADVAGGNSVRTGASHKTVTSGDATTVNLLFSAGPARYAECVAAYPA